MARKLSRKQENRIREGRQRRIDEFTADPSTLREGVVISRYGSQADIEDREGTLLRCGIRRTVGTLVSGDEILWRPAVPGEGGTDTVEAVLPRKSLLQRPDFYDGLKPVAANIEVAVVVASAVQPELSTNIIDRYLAACVHAGIEAAVIITKTDLLPDPGDEDRLRERLSFYGEPHVRLFLASSATGQGISAIRDFLSGRRSLLAGQSGVGKSSLLNVLLGSTAAEVGAVSDVSGLGQHTTTCTRLYRFPEGGTILDSPGVREFGLWHLSREDLIRGYWEFAPYLGTCRFKDCRHQNEKGCAVRQAVAEGQISPERYDNYLRILEDQEQVRSRAGFRRACTDPAGR